MTTHIRVGSSWVDVDSIHARVGGSWVDVAEGFTKVDGSWVQFYSQAPAGLTIEYLVIAGGGGTAAGGGGAGGYRSSVTGELSGGGASAESPLSLAVGTSYTVTIGAGGTADASGSNSVFSTITSIGGGYGRNSVFGGAVSGGSGGGYGGGAYGTGAAGTAGQGYAGGNGGSPYPNDNGGGGGGAGGVGLNGASGYGGNGGPGVASSITGTSVYRAGGGGGQSRNNLVTTGGVGGGGNGGNAGGGPIGGTAGAANTGSGAGGGYDSVANGGSGVVIISYPNTYYVQAGPGLVYNTVANGSNNVTTFYGGSDNMKLVEGSMGVSGYELIQTQELSSEQASIVFDVSSYASTYKHLQIRAVGRTNRSTADSDPVIMQFNSDAGSNYSRHALGAYDYNGSGTYYSNSAVSQSSIYVTDSFAVNASTSGAYGAVVIDIVDAFSSNKYTTVRCMGGLHGGLWKEVAMKSGSWLSTSPVSTIQLSPLIGTAFSQYSRFSIYGLKGS